ncbi:MAG: hypothetical protein HY535_07200 [Chloroflexi bacterium]|nr:hypothetical protein [Chloroflexota bacterium]
MRAQTEAKAREDLVAVQLDEGAHGQERRREQKRGDLALWALWGVVTLAVLAWAAVVGWYNLS